MSRCAAQPFRDMYFALQDWIRKPDPISVLSAHAVERLELALYGRVIAIPRF